VKGPIRGTSNRVGYRAGVNRKFPVKSKGIPFSTLLIIAIAIVGLVLIGVVLFFVIGDSSDDLLPDGDDGTSDNGTTVDSFECSDGIDNDGDGYVDLLDFGCDSVEDNSEINFGNTQCSDGIDNDGDNNIDQEDVQCVSRDDNSEGTPSSPGGGSDPGGSGDPGPSGPTCGDGVVEGGEECDDGNTVNGDGCSAGCLNQFGILITSPEEGEVSSILDLDLDFTITDPDGVLDSCWYTIDAGTEVPITCAIGENSEVINVLSEGEHTVTVYVIDTSGTTTLSDNVVITVLLVPTVTIVSPSEGEVFPDGNVEIDFNVFNWVIGGEFEDLQSLLQMLYQCSMLR